jgi:DNA-binding response OmpR family regulator
VLADDAILRATLVRCLLAAGYAVELAESTNSAREVLAAGSIALAMVDAGRQAATADLARDLLDSSARVIAIIESEAVDSNSPSIPASGYVFKPLSEQNVLAQVESLLQESPKLDVQTGPQVLRFEGCTLDVSGWVCFVSMARRSGTRDDARSERRTGPFAKSAAIT